MDDYKILENNFEQYYQLNNVKILLEWDKYVNLPPESNFTFVDNIHALELAQNSLIKQGFVAQIKNGLNPPLPKILV